MDLFMEHLVKKELSSQERMKKYFLWGLVSVILAALFLAGFIFYQLIFRLIFFAVIILIVFDRFYGSFWLYLSMDIEFEYILTNGELDVDMIQGRTKRSRLISVPCKDFEFLKPLNQASENEKENRSYQKKIDACISPDDPATYIAAFSHDKLGYVRLLFSPSERMLQEYKKIIPGKMRV